MDSEEKEQIEEWREKAKKELHDWYERRDEQLGKTQTSNRYVFFLPRFSSWYSGYFFYIFCNNKLWLYNTCMCQILGFYAELLKTKSFWLEQYCDVTQKTCSE